MASPAQDQHQRSSFRDILHNWKTAEKQYSNGIEMLDRDDMNQLKDMFTYFAKLEAIDEDKSQPLLHSQYGKCISIQGLQHLLQALGLNMSVDRTKYLLNEAVTTIRDEAFPEIPANPSNTATTTSLHSWLLRTKSVTVPEPATAPAPPTFERNSSWLTTINTKGKQAAGERAVLPALSRLPSLGKELTGPKKDITWDTEAIHFQTFLIFYAAATKDLSVEQEMQQVFELLDDNNDGRILVSYFHQVLGVMFNHLPAENIRNLTLEARVATNENISDDEWLRNGVITYDDFVVFCSN